MGDLNEEPQIPPRDELDFIDEAVARITDADIDAQLRKVLSQSGSSTPPSGLRDYDITASARSLCDPALVFNELTALVSQARKAEAAAVRQLTEAREAVVAARQEAAQIVADAREETDIALTQAAQMLRTAKEAAAQILSNARAEATQILGNAQAGAEQIIDDALGQAESIATARPRLAVQDVMLNPVSAAAGSGTGLPMWELHISDAIGSTVAIARSSMRYPSLAEGSLAGKTRAAYEAAIGGLFLWSDYPYGETRDGHSGSPGNPDTARLSPALPYTAGDRVFLAVDLRDEGIRVRPLDLQLPAGAGHGSALTAAASVGIQLVADASAGPELTRVIASAERMPSIPGSLSGGLGAVMIACPPDSTATTIRLTKVMPWRRIRIQDLWERSSAPDRDKGRPGSDGANRAG
jgi:vacuolar-type H+-ATPase subunit E/Vma4